MSALEDIPNHEKDFGPDWFHFAEYMIYSDMWSVRIKDRSSYQIFNRSDEEIILSNSLHQFLERFYIGNVFEPGGLYAWHDEVKLP